MFHPQGQQVSTCSSHALTPTKKDLFLWTEIMCELKVMLTALEDQMRFTCWSSQNVFPGADKWHLVLQAGNTGPASLANPTPSIKL